MRPFLHLGRSPITTRPLFLFSIWVGHPLQFGHSPCFFYLGRSPITMRPFLHLGRSPITTRPLFLFFIWVGHPLQFDHSPCFLSGQVTHYNETMTPPGQVTHYNTTTLPCFHLGRSPITIRPILHVFLFGQVTHYNEIIPSPGQVTHYNEAALPFSIFQQVTHYCCYPFLGSPQKMKKIQMRKYKKIYQKNIRKNPKIIGVRKGCWNAEKGQKLIEEIQKYKN